MGPLLVPTLPASRPIFLAEIPSATTLLFPRERLLLLVTVPWRLVLIRIRSARLNPISRSWTARRMVSFRPSDGVRLIARSQ